MSRKQTEGTISTQQVQRTIELNGSVITVLNFDEVQKPLLPNTRYTVLGAAQLSFDRGGEIIKYVGVVLEVDNTHVAVGMKKFVRLGGKLTAGSTFSFTPQQERELL